MLKTDDAANDSNVIVTCAFDSSTHLASLLVEGYIEHPSAVGSKRASSSGSKTTDCRAA